MLKLRHEINITNGVVGGASGVVLGANGIILIDSDWYQGTVTAYLEAHVTTAHAANTLTLRRMGTTTDDASISVAATGLIRSTGFTPVSGQTAYGIYSASTTVRIKSARVVIIQEVSVLSHVEVQAELGNAATTTSTVNVPTSYPKYWYYDSAQWSGALGFYFEATIKCASSKSATTAVLQESASITPPSWSDVAFSTLTTTSTVAERVRSNVLALTPDRWYRMVFRSGTTKSAATVYNAKVVIHQGGHGLVYRDSIRNLKGGTTSSTKDEAIAQSFLLGAAATLTGVKLPLRKVGSPTGTLLIDLVSSLGGTALASATISEASLATATTWYELTFSSPYAVNPNVTYYIQLSRSPDTYDTTNYVNWGDVITGGDAYTSGAAYGRQTNVWSEVTGDNAFVLLGASITKTELQYLIANSLFAAGTGLQSFLTAWDTAEWSEVTQQCALQADAASVTAADVELWEADGGGAAICTVTNIDNSQISAAATSMPTSQNLDVKATTNSGDIACARILVRVTIAAAGRITPFLPRNIAVMRAGNF